MVFRDNSTLLLTTLVACLSATSASGYDFQKAITLDRTKISDASCGPTLANFPVLFSVTDADLRHTSFGGDVTDLGGDDIRFVGLDAATCGGPTSCALDHEIEKYVESTGELVAWVRIPQLNTATAGADTVIYIIYGDSTVAAPTENPTGVWDANHVAVWHLGEAVTDEQTVGTHADSTGLNDGTQNNNAPSTGQIGNAQAFDGTADYIDVGLVNDDVDVTKGSFSAWIRMSPMAVNGVVFSARADANNNIETLWADGLNNYTFKHKAGGVAQLVEATNMDDTDGLWHLIAFTWDTGADELKGYVDGAQFGPTVTGLGAWSGSINSNVAIGAQGESSHINGFIGVIDEVQVSDVARSACWLGASYNNQVWPDKAVTPTPNPSPNPSSGFYTVGAETAIAGCTLVTSGAPNVLSGTTYTLDLTAIGTAPTSWTINWGDGAIQTFAGNPASVNHTYDAPIPSIFTYNILASAVCGGMTYFQNDLVVPSGGNDRINWYAHDPVTNTAVIRAPTQSGPDAGLNFPLEGIIGPDGNLYVSGLSSGNVLRYDPATGAFIDEFATGNAAASGIAFGPDGHLYVGDTTNSVVNRYSGTTGAFIDTFVTAGLGGLDQPEGLIFGPDGHLYVSDFRTHAVYRYDGSTGAFLGVFVAAGSGGLNNPEDLVFGPDGNLYVASDRNHNVLRFNGTTGAFMNVFVAAGSGGLQNAQGVAFGPDGNLYVSSWRNHNVLRYDPTTGAFLDVYVAGGLGGVTRAEYFNFIPQQQVTVVEPTAVKLTVFDARGVDGAVELTWETGSELDNLGFHLHRSVSPSGPWERITASLVPGLGSSPEGARYRYLDSGLTNGITYFYVLEDVETTGRTERHGPVSATPIQGDGTDDPHEPAEGETPSVITFGYPETNQLRVVKRGRDQVVLELTTAGFFAYPQPDGSVLMEIPDYVHVDASGLPVKRSWVDAVAGKQVELRSVREKEIASIGLRPAGSSTEELTASPDGVVRLRRAGAGRAHDNGRRTGPADAARLVQVGFQGDVKKALVEMVPLTWDPSQQRLRLAKKLYVTLSFAKRERERESDKEARRGRPRSLGGGLTLHLVTGAPGLYEVSFEDVFGTRYSRTGVEASRLRLSRLGEPVAFHLEPSSSRFAPGSVLYFVSVGGEANPYGPEAVYELEYGASGGASMVTRDASPSGASAPFYLRRDVHEENRIYQPALMEADSLWMWDSLLAPARTTYRFAVDSLAETAAEPARLELWLQGGSDLPQTPDHHVAVTLNGQRIGERRWNAKRPQTLDLELGPGVLQEGENVLVVENVGDTEAAYSLVFVDRYAVSYPRRTSLESGRLEGRFTVSGTAEVSGVSRSGAVVLDTSQPRPVWLIGALSSGENRLRFRAEANRRYLVVGAGRVMQPEIRAASRSRPSDDTSQADYVVIGPEAFIDAARSLLHHRRRQGLTLRAVSIESLYEEYGYGENRPEAIRDFLADAYHHWARPAPRYVLLLGDATYDFGNVYGASAVNRVPPLIVETPFLWTASDPTYAAVNGDDALPDLAIGRLPAANLSELRVMVAKILAYETGDASLDSPVVLVNDNRDRAGDFHRDAEELAATALASHATRRISLDLMDVVTARDAIVDSFDTGASVMSYVGHGGIHLWADEKLFDVAKVSSLSPQPQQPILLTMNCLNGYFHFPFFDSLSEALLKADGKGAIAAFAPSGLSLNGPAHEYHKALLNELFHGTHARLGDAVLAAQAAFAESSAFPELLTIYNLLGDPALKLR